jgi:ribosomal protein L29
MKDLKKMTDADLNKNLEEKRKSLMDLRFNMSGTNKRNSKDAATLKREIATILTEQKNRKETK